MRNIKLLTVASVFVLSALSLLMSGGLGPVSAFAADPMADSCVSPENLTQEIAAEAQVEAITCSFKTYEGVETLHMKVTLKNISDQPQRYRINIFLDNGKAMGGLIPVSLKQGLVEPGKTGSFEYPFMNMTQKPKEVVLRISTSKP